MRRKCILACLLAVMLLMMCSVALADTCTVTATKLILRENADSNSKALQTLPQGTKLEIVKKEGHWYKVTYGRFTGYVYDQYVTLSDAVVKDDGILQKGDKGDDVKAVQQRLKELNYYDATCDGQFGNVTVNAVKAFQKKNGLPDDGLVGKTTLKKLNSSSAIAANGKTAGAVAKEDKEDDGVLKKGAKGDDVKKLQQRLKELGYYKSTCDGNYGNVTVTAVKAFQKKNGLTADGVAGASTLKKLNSSSAIGANGKTEKEEEAEKDDGTLKRGSKGDEVKKVQQRLKALGYYSYGCDGDFGERTVTAVKAFQKKNGLTADGVVGATTLKKLNSDSAINAQGSTDVELISSQTLQRGDNGAQVKALQSRLKKLGYYTNSLDSDYGYRTAAAVSDFQRANGLTVNGIANSVTIKKMLSSNAVTKAEADKKKEDNKTIKTENLDWFKKGKSVFSGRPIIQVKDVRTGLVFKAKVLYGTNHLDVEPLTKADTAILLKINGGVDYSWHRRPMLVKHNGHVYAASIYSVPHGSQTILDNNFNGQFCLHFYGSKTHGTDEVKDDHQACVAEALKATW